MKTLVSAAVGLLAGFLAILVVPSLWPDHHQYGVVYPDRNVTYQCAHDAVKYLGNLDPKAYNVFTCGGTTFTR